MSPTSIPITFIEPDGSEKQVEAEVGLSLMVAAQDNEIVGIDALCNGCCSCGTCHIEFEADTFQLASQQYSGESQVLSNLTNLSPFSRLACQVIVTDALENSRLKIRPFK